MSRWRSAVAAPVVALAAFGCGPSGPERLPPVAREDAEAHVFRIGKSWATTTETQGFMQRDPLGVASFRVREEVTFAFGPGVEAQRRIVRDEVFGMVSGGELHCTVKGALPLVVRSSWKAREVRVLLESHGGRLPRTCEGGKLPLEVREVPAFSALYALREDRLVPIEPPTLHDVLLPQ